MTREEIASQRFMVSPCGLHADYVLVDEITTKTPGWSDCTDMSDTELQQFMVRRMWTEVA